LAQPPPSFSSPAAAQLLPPFSAQSARRLPLTDRWAYPVREPGRLPPPARATAARLVGCRCSACRHPSPSRTRMELDRTAARPPSLSRTSSAPHRLPSPNQCRNRRVQNPPPSAASDPSPRLPRPYKRLHTPPPPSPQPFATFLIVSLGSELRVREKKLPPICFSAAGHPLLPHRPLKPQVSFALLPSPSFPSRGELSETIATGGESSGEPLSGAAVRPPGTAARLLVHHSVSPAHQFF
jgi:hypothetical protein